MSAADIALEFADTAEQFIHALGDCFPEDALIAGYRAQWQDTYANEADDAKRAALRDRMIRSYHEAANQYYPLCLQRDERVFEADVQLVRDLGLKAKFEAGLHDQTADSIWQYILKLNQFAGLWAVYVRIPTGLMRSVQSMQDTLQSQVQTDADGNVNLASLDFGTLSQQLMSSINQNDMQEFAGSLQGQGGVGDIGSMFTMLAGMMQGISGGGAAGTTGAPDAQAMLASAAQALGGEPNSSGDQ